MQGVADADNVWLDVALINVRHMFEVHRGTNLQLGGGAFALAP